MESIGELFHKLEDDITQENHDRHVLVERFELEWCEVKKRLERVKAQLEKSSSNMIEIFPEEFQALKSALAKGPSPEILDAFEKIEIQPIKPKLDKLKEVALRTANRLLKTNLKVLVKDHQIRFERNLEELWDAMVHLVNNAVDHGIESTVERIVKKKPEFGEIQISAEVKNGKYLLVKIQDDGNGIDWKKILQKAEKLGVQLKDGNYAREELLFLEGITTKEQVSTVSGRGVGTSAILDIVRKLGGKISVDTELGQGTVISISIPEANAFSITSIAADNLLKAS